MPFLRDTAVLALEVLGQFLAYLAQLGFVTREFCVQRNDRKVPYEFRSTLPVWRIRFPGWSRYTRIHHVTERETLYLWL